MRKILFAFLVCSCSYLSATVSFNVQSGVLRDGSGSTVNTGITAILVADTGGNGFGGDYVSSTADFSVFDGVTFSQGNSLAGFTDDIIITSFSSIDLGGGLVGVNGSITDLNVLSGDFSENDEIALYWIPTITTGSHTGNVAEYGFFRSDTTDSDAGSEMAWFLPNDGSNLNLSAFDSTVNPGTTTGPSATALTATAVPEPSTYAALAGFCALSWVMLRRCRG